MAGNDNIRNVLLNHMVCISKTAADDEHNMPIHGAEELLEILENRRKQGIGIEYINSTDSEDDKIRAANGEGHDFVRLKDYLVKIDNGFKYICLLFELADHDIKTLPVVHTKTLTGREISGEADEVGASTAHLLVRVPHNGSYDDGSYRCVLEFIQGGIGRKFVSSFMRRQIRRAARQEDWRFDIDVIDKNGKPEKKTYRYWPRIDLLADVGRSLSTAGSEGRLLSHMVFTNRSEKREAGQKTSVKHAEYEASVDVKVNVMQGPENIVERRNWVQGIRDYYKDRGYTSRLFYKNSSGDTVGGRLHKEIEGAMDLIMCPREPIYLSAPPQRWLPEISQEIVGKLRELVDRDGLWNRVG